jgi:hypothetical protein
MQCRCHGSGLPTEVEVGARALILEALPCSMIRFQQAILFHRLWLAVSGRTG